MKSILKKTTYILLLVMLLSLLAPASIGLAETAEPSTDETVTTETTVPTAEPEATAVPDESSSPEPSPEPTDEQTPDETTKSDRISEETLSAKLQSALAKDTLVISDLFTDDVWDEVASASAMVESIQTDIKIGTSLTSSDLRAKDMKTFFEGLSRFRFTKLATAENCTAEQYKPYTNYTHLGQFIMSVKTQNTAGENTTKKYEFTFYGEILWLQRHYYLIDDPVGLFSYVKDFCDTHNLVNAPSVYKTRYTDYDPENRTIMVKPLVKGETTPEQNSFTLYDRLSFNVEIDETHTGTILEELAGKSGVIHCTVEYIGFSGTYILTLEGSEGTRQFFHRFDDFSFGTVTTYPCIRFAGSDQIIDGDFQQIYERDETSWAIHLAAESENDELKDLRLDLHSSFLQTSSGHVQLAGNAHLPMQRTAPNTLYAKNVEYEVFEESSLQIYNYLTHHEWTKGRTVEPTEESPADEDVTATEEPPAGEQEDAQNFLDVPAGHWAYDAIHAFSRQKIVNGYGNGYFGTNDSITYEHYGFLLERLFSYTPDDMTQIPAIREEVIVSLVKALGLDVSTADEAIIDETFSDCEKLQEENKPYIAAAISNGLVIGADGKLFADQSLTRAECVVLLARACDNLSFFPSTKSL